MTAALPFYIREDDPPAKREILRAALKLFSEGGLAGTSIRDIAEESGYTNPALYKHFASKEELALYLFETCHQRIWRTCARALASQKSFDEKVDAYIHEWLRFMDEYPDVIAFLSDSARILWPKASPQVRKQTMISLAYSLVAEAPQTSRIAFEPNTHLAVASLQGTLAELARMIQVGVLKGPASRWKADLVTLFKQIVA